MPLALHLFVTEINGKNCPTTNRMPATVILSPSAKLRINSARRAIVILSRAKDLEILRLTPQNDVVGHPLGMVIAFEVDEVG
jgi:hypothetical protein